MEAERGVTILTCIEAPSILKVQKDIGFKDTIRIVSFLLKSIIDTLKVAHKPTEESEIFILASDFMEQYKYETLEDFVLCFKKARKNCFGENYHRIDSTILFQWMGKHLEEKAIALEKIHHQAKYPTTKEPALPNPKLDELVKAFTAPKLRSTPKIPQISDSKYNDLLTEQIPHFDEEAIQSVKTQAMKINDRKVLKIIENELKRRNDSGTHTQTN
jgi:hypothetical protein